MEHPQIFLDSGYARAAVRVHVIPFTFHYGNFSLFLKRETGSARGDNWTTPSMLFDGQGTLEGCARRVLEYETGILSNAQGPALYQLAAFDPEPLFQDNTVCIAYTALIPEPVWDSRGREESGREKLWEIVQGQTGFTGVSRRDAFLSKASFMPGQHTMVTTALKRLQGRLNRPDMMEFLPDKQWFTIYELKHIYDEVLRMDCDNSNFRKWFQRLHVKKGWAAPAGEYKHIPGMHPAMAYQSMLNQRIKEEE